MVLPPEAPLLLLLLTTILLTWESTFKVSQCTLILPEVKFFTPHTGNDKLVTAAHGKKNNVIHYLLKRERKSEREGGGVNGRFFSHVLRKPCMKTLKLNQLFFLVSFGKLYTLSILLISLLSLLRYRL